MTKPLDPEIKGLRAIDRALRPLDKEAQRRMLEWAASRLTGRMVRLGERRSFDA